VEGLCKNLRTTAHSAQNCPKFARAGSLAIKGVVDEINPGSSSHNW
jgi:hypothetical protein